MHREDLDVVILNQPQSIDSRDHQNGRSQKIQNGYSGASKLTPIHLQPLASTNRVIIKQKKEMLEVILGCETENKYDILDEDSQVIYTVEESSEFCLRCLCGPYRPIVVYINDLDGNNAIFLKRALGCQDICCPCMLQSMDIFSPQEKSIGRVIQKWRLRPELHVINENNQTEFIIKGPWCQFSCRCGDVDYPIYSSDGVSECGKISKRWRGILHEMFTDTDTFGIQFPPGITPIMKALLIGATFLIDYMFFEQNKQLRSNYA